MVLLCSICRALIFWRAEVNLPLPSLSRLRAYEPGELIAERKMFVIERSAGSISTTM